MRDLDIFVIAALGFAAFVILARLAWRTREIEADDHSCCHSVQSDERWTQDGWVTVCLMCRTWLYHGDRYYADMPAKREEGQ